MSETTSGSRSFGHRYLRPVVRRFKKITGIGRVSALNARVDQLSLIVPRGTQLETIEPRIEVLERRIDELESLCRELVGLQYLRLAGGDADVPCEDPPSKQRHAK